MHNRIIDITRRRFFDMLATGAGLVALGLPAGARGAEGRDDVLVIGMDIGDAINFDPAVATAYTPPIVTKVAYDTLVTMTPGDYINIKPALATAWQRTPDGRGWRFTLRQGTKFNSGNVMTAEDVKWSFDRVINLKGQPALYISNITGTAIVDADHFDIYLKEPGRPILDILCCFSFVVYERKALEQHGGVATADASTADKAVAWLNQNSCGTGAYTLTAWQRNAVVQFERNPHYWRAMPGFPRVIIRHMAEPATQLLAIQRGDIDVAFNLIPEQVATVKQSTSKSVRVDQLESLDMVYLALTTSPEMNKALAVREARQAIGCAIDFEGIVKGLLGGAAQMPASLLPIGALGSTLASAREVGFKEDLGRAKALMAKAGFPDGFSFKLSYGTVLIAGVSYGVIAQKIQADLARVNIRVDLDPLDSVTMRTQYNSGHSQAVMAFWSAAGVDNWNWTSPAVDRVAKRMHYDPPKDIVELVDKSPDEPDLEKQAKLWVEYQRRMVEEAYLMVLFQPNYQVAIRDRIKTFPLTAAGWFVDLYAAKT